MVTDKPLRPRSCAGSIRAGVGRRDISRHYTSVCGYLLITGPSPRWPAEPDHDPEYGTFSPHCRTCLGRGRRGT